MNRLRPAQRNTSLELEVILCVYGVVSPLLANVLLDEVDRELERRGHKFVRYADDCNVYVKSLKAGARVLQALRGCYAKLALKVNEAKTAVARYGDASSWATACGRAKAASSWRCRASAAQRCASVSGS